LKLSDVIIVVKVPHSKYECWFELGLDPWRKSTNCRNYQFYCDALYLISSS